MAFFSVPKSKTKKVAQKGILYIYLLRIKPLRVRGLHPQFFNWRGAWTRTAEQRLRSWLLLRSLWRLQAAKFIQSSFFIPPRARECIYTQIAPSP
jgi:hypothetical protein